MAIANNYEQEITPIVTTLNIDENCDVARTNIVMIRQFHPLLLNIKASFMNKRGPTYSTAV